MDKINFDDDDGGDVVTRMFDMSGRASPEPKDDDESRTISLVFRHESRTPAHS